MEKDKERVIETDRVKFDAKVINEHSTNGKILDIGCYDKLLRKFLKRGLIYRGIDYPKVDLEKNRLPFDNKSFDYISCFEVLEHLIDPTNCIKEIKRVVRDNGLIFISLPNQSTLPFRIRILLGKPYGQPFETDKYTKHYHDMTYNQARGFINKHFNILKVCHFGDYNQTIKLRVGFLASRMPTLFSYHNVFVCKVV